MNSRTPICDGWFADRVVLGRVLAGLGGYLGWHLLVIGTSPAFAAVALTGFVLALVGMIMLIRRDLGLGGCGLVIGGFVTPFALWLYPFGPAFLVGAVGLLGLLALLSLLPAPARTRRAAPRIAALLAVLVVTAAALGFGAYEAWVLWPEAFSLELPLADTYALLRDDELASVTYAARLWSGTTVIGVAVLLILAAVPPARFGVRRILALGFGLAAAALVNLQLGAWPVGWNLTDYDYFETPDYPWASVVKLVEALLFAAAFLIAAIRMPDEVAPRETPTPDVEPTSA